MSTNEKIARILAGVVCGVAIFAAASAVASFRATAHTNGGQVAALVLAGLLLAGTVALAWYSPVSAIAAAASMAVLVLIGLVWRGSFLNTPLIGNSPATTARYGAWSDLVWASMGVLAALCVLRLRKR